jgi:uncharacterized protein YbjQ (UPF0145 family)
MNIRGFDLSRWAALAACALSGCASTPSQDDIAKQAAAVKVYRSAELAGTPYDVVGHLWVDSWRTAYTLPTYPSADEAVDALRAQAALAGADGVINVVCIDQRRTEWFRHEQTAFLCYGGAIRLRPGAG